jgi:hypothetical protein
VSVYGYKYGRVPEALLYSAASDRACRLHALLTRWADTRPEEHPTRRELAALLHCSMDSVDRAVKELEKAGFLQITPRYAEGVRIANIYEVDVRGGRTDAEGSRTDAATITSENAKPAGDGGRTGAAGGGRTGAAVNKERTPITTEEEGTTSAAKQPRPEVDELCQLLADQIVANDGSPAVYLPRVTSKAWRDPMRLLLDKDLAVDKHGQPVPLPARVEKARKAIIWCQASVFWRKNVLSPAKLREKYDQLRLAALEEQQSNGHRNGNGQPARRELPQADLSDAPPFAGPELARYYGLEPEGAPPS